MKKLAYLILLPLLAACGGDNGPGPLQSTNDAQFNGQSVRLISEPGALTSNGDTLQGTGTSIFRQPIDGGMASDAGYELLVELNDGGSVTLVSHAGAELQGGLEMRFTRRGSGRGSLQVSLTAGGRTVSTVNSVGIDVFGNIDASRPLWLQVDVHNDEAGEAHVLAWDLSEGIDHFTGANSILNTDTNMKSNGSPGKGGGSRWGLILRQAVVKRANQGEGQYHHH